MMTIKLKGLNKLIRKFDRLENLNRELAPAMHRSTELARDAIADYPPPPGGSQYIRTGTLGRRWSIRVITGRILQGVVENITRYAKWVQYLLDQARVHRGRWQTIQSVVKKVRPAVVKEFQKEVNRLLRK